ncbi:Hypothetical predicted protein [Octopus vulgaris]|uniref:Uncharacterized protein n=1 Tax=Octopus vulgaris TaxID=6645 RepID=A0AA36BB30_OCTVU|nr:Hypothetical predicted protein [Octopus vulgaris]
MMAYELEKLRLQISLEQEKCAAGKEKQAHELKLKANQIDSESEEADVATPSKHFNIASACKFVPRFQDSDLDNYFLAFEKTAELMKWPKTKWSILLQTQLTGKSLEVYSAMSIADCKDYDLVKQKILYCHEQVAEVYQQKLRQAWKNSCDSYIEFTRKKGHMGKQKQQKAQSSASSKPCHYCSVEVAVPLGFKCISDTGVLSKIKLDPDVGVSDADLVMTSVVDNSSVDATSDSSSTPKSVTVF